MLEGSPFPVSVVLMAVAAVGSGARTSFHLIGTVPYKSLHTGPGGVRTEGARPLPPSPPCQPWGGRKGSLGDRQQEGRQLADQGRE